MVMVQSAAPPDRQHVIRVRRAASGLGSPWLWKGLLRGCFPCPCRGLLRGFFVRWRVRESSTCPRELLRDCFVRGRCGCSPFPCRALLRDCFVRGRCFPCLCSCRPRVCVPWQWRGRCFPWHCRGRLRGWCSRSAIHVIAGRTVVKAHLVIRPPPRPRPCNTIIAGTTGVKAHLVFVPKLFAAHNQPHSIPWLTLHRPISAVKFPSACRARAPHRFHPHGSGHGAQETSLSRTGCEHVRLFLKCGDENNDGDSSGNGGASAAGLER